LIRDHAGRARQASVGARTARRWNLAADAEINDDLRHDAIELPGGILPETIAQPPGKAAEDYFARLLEGDDPDPPHLSGCGPGCPGRGDGGPGCHAVRGPGRGTGADGEGLDGAEVLLLRRRVAEEVRTWARGREAGDGHAGWVRWADSVLEPRLDWRRLLHG